MVVASSCASSSSSSHFSKALPHTGANGRLTVRRRVGSRRVVPLLRSERSSHRVDDCVGIIFPPSIFVKAASLCGGESESH